MDQRHRSPLSQTTVQCSPESSWAVILDGGLGFSTQPLGLFVPDADISGDIWSRLPFISMKQQPVNEFHPPTAGQVDTIMNMYNPRPGHYSTLPSSDETLVTNEHQRPFMLWSLPLWSLPDVFPEPQTRIEVPGDQFAVQGDSTVDRTLIFDTDTPQSHDPRTDESRAITDVVASLGDLVCFMTEETPIPSMQFGAKPFSDHSSYSPTSSATSGASRVRTMHDESNRASRTHDEGEYLVLASTQKPRLESCVAYDRGLRVEKMIKKLHRCGCGVSFSQRQALTRHSKDKHSPKKRCNFCLKFTWSQGRHYIYRKHLQEEHPGVV